MINKDEHSWWQSKWKPIVEPWRAFASLNPLVKIYEEAVIESEARTVVVQLKSDLRQVAVAGVTPCPICI